MATQPLQTVAPGETGIPRIVIVLRQLIQYVQGLVLNAGTVTSVATGVGLTGGPITASGTVALSMTSVTNSLGADVALNNVANYFDGPSIAQGVTGTWLATGTVTVIDSAGASNFQCKLWDGTTVIDSCQVSSGGASFLATASLSGVLATPAANIRISCKDITSTSGKLVFNQSGNSKDCTLTAIRIK